MEGNLNRARSTLGNRPSPSVSSFSTHSPEPVSLYTLPAENGNLGGFSPSKHRQDHLSRVDENKQGHYRISSETSMPSTLHTNGQNGHSKASGENLDSKESHSEPGRSWFWNGLTRNTSINYASRRNNGLQPLNEDGPATESFEHPNAPRHEEIPDDETVDLSSPTVAAFKAQDPPATDLSRARSTRQMHELREQMQDLKGKISSLKRRAKEDNLRRRSLQSLRTPSPFTAAEQWYPGRQSQEHNQPNSRERSSDGDVSQNHCHTSPIAGRDGGIPDGEVNLDKALLDQPKLEEDAISGSPHVEEEKIDEDIIAMADRLILINEPSPVESEGKEDSLYGDQDYHDITTSPVVERHEDRPDAFDYEHFILHSVTGSYSGVGFRWSSSMRKRASSHSSTSSVETTKPRNSIVELMGEAVQETGSLSSGGHAKKTSVDSVSTNNTFATADEIRYSNDGQDWTPPRQTMAGSWQPEINKHNPNASPTSNKRRNKKHIYTALKSGAKIESNEKALPSPQSPDLLSYLTSFSSGEAVKEGERQAEPLQIGEGDRELVERLVESLAKLCAHLHNLGPDGTAHEARVCRHKLDTARRMLDGEVNGEAF